VELKKNLTRTLHVLGIAGLGVGVVWLVWMHTQIGLFGYFHGYEHNTLLAWFEAVLSFYFLAYYGWLLRNHWRHNPPWEREDSED
jgi:hypothetical protein